MIRNLFAPQANTAQKTSRLVLLTGCLLLIAASRIVQISILELNGDDVWSIWQTFGTPAQIVRWTPNDWPPLYYLALGVWRVFVGIQPLALRVSSILVFLIGIACLYRALRRIWNENVALLGILTYSAMAFSIFLSLFLRGYVLLMALAPIAFWLSIRYFDHPSPRRAILLAVSLLAMFFSHYTSLFFFGLLGLYTLCIYGRKVWRWWLPGLILLLGMIPHILSKLDTFLHRTGIYQIIELPPLPQAIHDLAVTFAGPTFPWWIVLFVAASGLIAWRIVRSRAIAPQTLVLIVWVISPVAIYLGQKHLGLFQSPKYMWWVLFGIALWLSWGLSQLPRRGQSLIAISLIAVMFWPNTMDAFQPGLPYSASFKMLQDNLRAADVVLVDPNCGCRNSETWDYFMLLYFPNGLHFVDNPDGYQRVWYISRDWDKDPTTEQALIKQHFPGRFFGPPSFLFRLYEAPPDPTGIAFENGMRFHGMEIDGIPTPDGIGFHAGQTVHMKLWWSVDKLQSLDYSIGVFLLVDNALAAQVDGPPKGQSVPQETSQWLPGHFYVQASDLTLPASMYANTYPLYLTLYQSWDNTRIGAPGMGPDKLLKVQTIDVHAWL